MTVSIANSMYKCQMKALQGPKVFWNIDMDMQLCTDESLAFVRTDN